MREESSIHSDVCRSEGPLLLRSEGSSQSVNMECEEPLGSRVYVAAFPESAYLCVPASCCCCSGTFAVERLFKSTIGIWGLSTQLFLLMRTEDL